MKRRARLAVFATIGLGAIALPPAARSDDRSRPVSLIKMPYRGERNLPDLSDSPDYVEKGGLQKLLEREGWQVRSTSTVALTPEEQKAYGEWNRLGLANGHLAQMVAAEIKEGAFPVGLLANCSALMGMLGGLQHSGPTSRPLRVGLVFIDAHGDFNTPETTLSGMLGGMPVAISAGLGLTRLRLKSGLDPALPERNMVLAGVRDVTPSSRTCSTAPPSSVCPSRTSRPGQPPSIDRWSDCRASPTSSIFTWTWTCSIPRRWPAIRWPSPAVLRAGSWPPLSPRSSGTRRRWPSAWPRRRRATRTATADRARPRTT